MLKARLFDFTLFFLAVAAALYYGHIPIEHDLYIKTLALYWLFSILYYHLRIINKKNKTSFDYGISYSLSFVIFTGVTGLFIFEVIHRLSVYVYKKWTKTADPGELLDTFYNIGCFVVSNSLAFYLYQLLYPSLHQFPIGFWILIFILVCITYLFSGAFLSFVFFILGDIKTWKEAVDLIIRSRSFLDIGKVAITNGLLLLLLQEEKWEMIIGLFILNYLVSRSFLSKSQSIQNKIERDRFEQMAYTDFLTNVANRAYMDKKMAELNESGEALAIVVADIDKFKKVNDTYNHAVGDCVIQHFASNLKESIDTDDFLFRSGGEEFTLFLRNKGFEECVHMIEKITYVIDVSPVRAEFKSETISISYTASFGLYFFHPTKQLSMEKGYVQADHLLLQSKELGRNKITAKHN